MSIRSLLNAVLSSRDLEIRERFGHAQRHGEAMRLLAKRGFAPGTVIDVGVATGTPWLHEAFKSAQLVLVEANPGFEADLARLEATYGAHVYRHAVGREAGEATLNIDGVAPSSSSLLHVSSALKEKWANAGAPREFKAVTVPVRTLDETLAGKNYRAPYLLKIDTEGFEREVLLGATDTLARTDIVVAEVSVIRRFEQSYEFAELIALLDARGFRVYDLVDVRTYGRQGPINYLDLAFVRRDSPIARIGTGPAA